MEYGLGIPTRGPLARRASIETIATRAKALGFSWLAVPDHLIVPRAIDSRYPYSDSGAFPRGWRKPPRPCEWWSAGTEPVLARPRVAA